MRPFLQHKHAFNLRQKFAEKRTNSYGDDVKKYLL